jgi:hypothetical protein
MNTYARAIRPAVEAALFKGKVVVIYGARQVGKTTLCCDEPDIRSTLTERTSTELRALIGAKTLIEPLTGRKIEFQLRPLSVAELLTRESALEARRLLVPRLRYGSYPGVVTSDDPVSTIATGLTTSRRQAGGWSASGANGGRSAGSRPLYSPRRTQRAKFISCTARTTWTS